MTNNDGRSWWYLIDIVQILSKIVFAPIYTRGDIEVAAEFCFTLVAVNGPRALFWGGKSTIIVITGVKEMHSFLSRLRTW